MLIAQISDTHLSERGQKTCGVAPMADNLRRCVESINAFDPTPDVVLLSGDVTNNFAVTEAELAVEILAGLAMPLFVVPGNHDDRAVLADVFGPARCRLSEAGFVDYVIEGYALRIIALDTLHAGYPGGQFDTSQRDWLRARLDEAPDQPTLIFAHHPPLKLGVPETDQDGFVGVDALGDLIAEYTNIERFLCGHVHLHTNTRWRGTMVTTAPSIGMQLALNLKDASDSKFLLADPAYLLHCWTDEQSLITHHIQVSNLEGPFEFS
ncbi:MAG: Icc protein [Yoonia sp.]|jgi:Icc protein